MAWLLVIVAGLLEVVWSVGLKYTDGFRRIGPSLVIGSAIVLSIYLLATAARTLPIGTAYAVWVGIGALGAAIAGVVLHGEPMSIAKAVFIGLLVISIVGLKLTS